MMIIINYDFPLQRQLDNDLVVYMLLCYGLIIFTMLIQLSLCISSYHLVLTIYTTNTWCYMMKVAIDNTKSVREKEQAKERERGETWIDHMKYDDILMNFTTTK